MKSCWKYTHPEAIKDLDEFISRTDLEKFALHHLLTDGSSAVNGCRQNKSPNSWLKHHNNPQVIDYSP